MTGSAQDTAGPVRRTPTPAEQRTARVMGAWFLGTFVFSIPAYFFYTPVLERTDWVTGAGADGAVGVGALLEVALAVSCVATAVVVFPVVRRVSEGVALGYVAARTVEALLILVGVLAVLSVVALREGAAVGEDGGLVAVGRGLVELHEQTRLLGPQLCAGLGNGILLGWLMWRSRLLPRPMVLIGLIGGPLAVAAGAGVLLGWWDMGDSVPVALTAPEAAWELLLTVWLLVKGFRPSPALTGPVVVTAQR